MKDISLKDLLEAGCHFGHKKEKWHPKATKFIYQAREGLHIIDLVKTREGLRSAAEFVRKLAEEGKTIIFVASKRQAKGVVSEVAKRAGISYLTNRWIGGFITNWDEVKKNIEKLNKMRREKTDGSWNKFPKHEQVALEKTLYKIEVVYGGVTELSNLPDVVFIVDIKKEIACLREAVKYGLTTVAIVDTNSDPNLVDYPIPANDDAVGSIKFIVDYLADAYIEGKKMGEKKALRQTQVKEEKVVKVEEVLKGDVEKVEKVIKEESEEKKVKEKKAEEKPMSKDEKPQVKKKNPIVKTRGKRGRPKKS